MTRPSDTGPTEPGPSDPGPADLGIGAAAQAGARQAGSVLRHGVVYFVGSLLNRSAGLILLPVYLHALSPAEFGVYAVLISLMDVVGIGIGLSLG